MARDADRRDVSRAFRSVAAYFRRLTPPQVEIFDKLPDDVKKAIVKREIQLGAS